MAAVCLDGAWDRWPSLVMCLEMVTMGDEGGQRAWSTALVDGRLSKQTPCVSFPRLVEAIGLVHADRRGQAGRGRGSKPWRD